MAEKFDDLSGLLNLIELLEPVENRIYKAFKNYFDSCRTLLLNGDGVIGALNSGGIFPNSATSYQLTTTHCFYVAVEHAASIYKLANHGLGPQAHIISRSLTEAFITLNFITKSDLKDQERLSDQYHAFRMVEELELCRLRKKIAKRRDNKEWLHSLEAKERELIERIRKTGHKFLDSDGKLRKKYKKGWSGKDTFQMAKESGCDYLYYDLDFRPKCKYVHLSPMKIEEHFARDKNEKRVWAFRESYEEVPHLLCSTYDLFFKIMEIFWCSFTEFQYDRFDEFEETRRT